MPFSYTLFIVRRIRPFTWWTSKAYSAPAASVIIWSPWNCFDVYRIYHSQDIVRYLILSCTWFRSIKVVNVTYRNSWVKKNPQTPSYPSSLSSNAKVNHPLYHYMRHERPHMTTRTQIVHELIGFKALTWRSKTQLPYTNGNITLIRWVIYNLITLPIEILKPIACSWTVHPRIAPSSDFFSIFRSLLSTWINFKPSMDN